MKARKPQLLFHGTLLFLVGLLTGLALASGAAFIANPRGVLAGHLEAVMNGTFLIAVAFFIDDTALSARARTRVVWLLLYGTWGNWLATTLAGILGTSEATPLAGAGHHGPWLAEKLIFFGLVSVALAMVVAVGTLLAGLRRA